ncbi:Oidioi.mRNA.OKI2018_I69.chr1.g3597.t1.cds [Oikopleura dioica]|uniref:Oidioi.mRNA.OKI2018_I69.chr1.g3597.t1.cds n=1 Tax=Oikopleura dioica TaxID=34765 RepID=A0ABN7SYW2_OIKDI|nr:Oidioi.mRNA.OKI2018_I69.chr1.g3597.t1.cds [Oikopleura dioica]
MEVDKMQSLFTTIRRRSDPVLCRRIWEAVNEIHADNENDSDPTPPDVSLILAKLTEADPSLEKPKIIDECEKMVEDDLLYPTCTVSNTGEEHWKFSIPSYAPRGTGRARDWYCFVCHQPGEVLGCRTCFRSYHINCLSEAPRTSTSRNQKIDENWTCLWCIFLKQSMEKAFNPEIFKKSMKMLLKMISQQHRVLDTPMLPLEKNFVFRHASLLQIKDLVEGNMIKCPEQFELEVRNIVHNFHVYFGPNDSKTARAEHALLNTREYVQDMDPCIECFWNKYESWPQISDKWRVKTCNPAHFIARVKHKTFGYTPAKVLSSLLAAEVQVMFFAGKAEKVTVDRGSVCKMTDESGENEKKRKSAQVTQAHLEMKEHIKALRKRFGADTVNRALNFESGDASSTNTSTVDTSNLVEIESVSQEEASSMETDVNGTSEDQTSKSQEVQKRNLRKKESTENKKDNLASDLGLLVERCDQSVQTDPYRSREDMKTIMHLREQLEHEMRRSNELKIKHNAILAAEVQKAKRKSWCNICSKEARYHCCASFFYCGTECQRNAWKDGHQEICKKRSSQKRPKSSKSETPEHQADKRQKTA